MEEGRAFVEFLKSDILGDYYVEEKVSKKV